MIRKLEPFVLIVIILLVPSGISQLDRAAGLHAKGSPQATISASYERIFPPMPEPTATATSTARTGFRSPNHRAAHIGMQALYQAFN